MNKKPICFIISPIGEAGSKIREDADDFLDLIIKPALDIFDFEVIRGDHRSEANQIDVDVIRSVQNAAICIADVSLPNPNVYYEVGRRDETGKPIILLKNKNSEGLPVDLGTRRYIEYDLDQRHGIRDAVIQLRNFVQPLVNSQFDTGSGATLGDIANTLQRLERKLDRIGQSKSAADVPIVTAETAGVKGNPKEAFQLARKQNNIQLMEALLDNIRVMTDKWEFLDYYVEITAARGSQKAGELLIENAYDFVEQESLSVKQKYEYLSHLVSYLNKRNLEDEHLGLVEKIADYIEQLASAEDSEYTALIYNQRNRLYYGVYLLTEDEKWLRKAIGQLEVAIKMRPDENALSYNLAVCYRRLSGGLERAANLIEKVIAADEAEGKPDDDHLKMACMIYRELNDDRYYDALDILKKVNPVKAMLLQED